MVHLKSSREIDKLRRSADLVGRTLAEVGRNVSAGVKTAELDRIAESFIKAHGATSAFKGYQFSRKYVPFPGVLCISVNDVVVHGFPSGYELQEGDLISVDCGVVLDGYYGDSAFTFAVGELAPETAALCRVTYESLMSGVERARVGGRLGDIGEAVQTHCESHGYGVVYDLVGHGIGRSLHEDPQVPNVGRAGTGKKMKEGLVMCIEPMVNQGTADVYTEQDGWTVRSADNLPSAHYEHMVAVRRGGPDVLSTFDYIEDVVTPPYRQVTQQHG